MKGKSLFFIITVLSVLLLAGLSLAFDSSRPCNQQTEFSTLVCGATPNSLQGYGAVDICGQCHPCGMSDGVCPEDFYSDGMRTSCKNCPDPDCKSDKNSVTVKVRVEGISEPSVDADVSVIYPDGTELLGNTGTDDIKGELTAPVRSGLIKLKAEYADYDSQIAEVYVPRGESTAETTVYLSEGSCNEDCTGSFREVCKADCDGINNCAFASYTGELDTYTSSMIASRCNFKPIGDKIELERNETHITYATCCSGEPIIHEERVQVDVSRNLQVNATNSIKHLAHHVVPVKYDGKIYDLVITSWED
ncbi:MAG: hypothetical protein ACQESE_02660 [Nanobdellota archaeon]